jgi:predicted nucleic acid-binding protein
MFLFDITVVSEARKDLRADARVTAWTELIDRQRVFLSVITLLELEMGVSLMERRDTRQGLVLRTWLQETVLTNYSGRILPVTEAVALRCGKLHVPDKRPERDALIAATALVHGLTVVTRNVADFAPMNVPVFNPWED